MQLSDFIFVINYLNEVFLKNPLPSKYQQLIALLDQSRQSPTPQLSEQILKSRKEIETINNQIEPTNWNQIQLILFKKYGASRLVGKGANEELSLIFETHQADPYGASQALQKYLTEINKLVTSAKQIKSYLMDLTTEEEKREIDENHAIIQILFDGEASVNTLNQLEQYAKKWKDILVTFSRITKTPPEEANIYTVGKSSPMLLTVGAVAAVVLAISRGSNEILSVYEKVLEIKKKSLEIRNLKLSNKKIEADLDREAETLLEEAAEKAAKKLIKDYKYKDTDHGEVKNALVVSLKAIFDFIQKGGKIDVQSNSEDEKEIHKQLSDAFVKIREVESNIAEIKKIEYNPADSAEEQ